MPTRTTSITTADHLLAASGELGPCELVRGELIMMVPAGFAHGRIESRIHSAIDKFASSKDLGVVTPGDTGFLLERFPDTVRSPDVAFVCKQRIPSVPPQGYFPGPPDLAVEIRSPDDRPNAVAEKIADYLRLGVQVVWDVNPETRSITVHRAGSEPAVFACDDTVTEPVLLPGFALAVEKAFAW